jgi:hypothetical protein
MTVNGQTVWPNTPINLPLGWNTSFVVTYIIPWWDETTDITNTYDRDFGNTQIPEMITIQDPWCEVFCGDLDPEAGNEDLVNHCKFEVDVDLEECALYTWVMKFRYTWPNLDNVNFRLRYVDWWFRNITIDQIPYESVDIGNNIIDYIEVTATSTTAIYSGQIHLFEVSHGNSGIWEELNITVP